MPELLIVRQPVYNRTQHVYGYALSYRPPDIVSDAGEDEGAAASQLILNAMTEIGIDNLVGTRTAFIKLSHDFVAGNHPLPLPGTRAVIDVQANTEITAELFAGIKSLLGQGYGITLSDLVYRESVLPLLDLASIIKIDVQALSEERLRTYVAVLKDYPNLKLLAENIEIPEDYEVCRELGFDYFQGRFFSRPRVIRRTRLPSNQLVLMQLLAEVQRPDVTIPKLEAIIIQDVGLSYKLLRHINSAFFGMPKPIDSIQKAVLFLGTKVIQKWVTLLILARVDDKPAELMITAVVRAKMCEMLARAVKFEHQETCFTVGLLSVLEALLDLPMEKILGMLSLTTEVNQALLHHTGVPGKLLQLTLHYEQGHWNELAHPELEEDLIMDAYLQSVAWASEACRSLLGD